MHDFSAWQSTGFNQADVDRFRSHTGKQIKIIVVTVTVYQGRLHTVVATMLIGQSKRRKGVRDGEEKGNINNRMKWKQRS